MVSTRQMTIVHGGATDSEHPATEGCPAKTTRHNSATSSSHPGSSGMKGTNPGTALVRAEPANFLDLPDEVIERIVGYLSYKNVSQLRFLCTRIDRICGHILNTTFQRLQHQLLDRFHVIKSKMPRRESARRNHHLACESDIIETLHMRLTLLQMSLGKHIERKHCCFFPGEILDEVLHILHYIKVTPKLARPYKVTDELFDLSTMAMEYFKEKIEPNLPEIAYFSTDFLEFSASSTNKYLCMDPFSMDMDESKDRESQGTPDLDSNEASVESTPQSNMVLRKGIRKIKQGMKKYNNQLSILRQDVRSCRQKATEQSRLISEQQKQLAEQQKQLLEYATRMDEHDKKNDEISRKFSTLLQELNKCKTEIQYYRSKSPAAPPCCTACGAPIPICNEELEALTNDGNAENEEAVEEKVDVVIPTELDPPPEIDNEQPEQPVLPHPPTPIDVIRDCIVEVVAPSTSGEYVRSAVKRRFNDAIRIASLSSSLSSSRPKKSLRLLKARKRSKN